MTFNATKIHEISQIEHPLLDDMLKADHYVISDDLMNILKRDDVERTIEAVIAAGLNHLPFNPMLVEFQPEHDPDVSDDRARYFVLLTEKGTGIECRMAVLISKDGKPWKGYFKDNALTVEVYDDGILVVDQFRNEMHIAAATCAVYLAFLMLNTRGIEKEHVDMRKLNKQRQKKGKPTIPNYTYVRVGTVYDRDGKPVKNGNGHRKMPVHWRSGHVRHQRCGEGGNDRKLIFIPAVLVNFRDEGGMPARKIRKVSV